MDVRWEDPPPPEPEPGPQTRAEMIEVLKTRPGRWAIWTTDTSTRNQRGRWEADGCEVEYRQNPYDGSPRWRQSSFTMYVRWPADT